MHYGIMVLVAASLFVVNVFVKFGDWLEVLPGRNTQRIIALVSLVALVVAVRYDSEAATKPFLDRGQQGVELLMRIVMDATEDFVPATPPPASRP